MSRPKDDIPRTAAEVVDQWLALGILPGGQDRVRLEALIQQYGNARADAATGFKRKDGN